MSEEALGLGQREVDVSSEFTAEEINLIEQSGITLHAVKIILGLTNAKITVNAAIGGTLDVKRALDAGETVADPRPVEGSLPADVLDEAVEKSEEVIVPE